MVIKKINIKMNFIKFISNKPLYKFKSKLFYFLKFIRKKDF